MKITDDMLTEWFPDHVKPVHEGIYPTRIVGMPLSELRCIWNGARWMYLDSPKQPRIFQDLEWRGLKEPQRD
ncbi:hypothetical protein QZM15_33030 [Burkholderia sp. AU44665]|uniref:hypothetical protein n=1 Tax=Burkholderia sp. AU44665 TaxID=3059203 RepID=UPI00265E1772|nr:hypothetical protein [Burkholderia sp. AU44665]MDN7703311.1 hypothetical protein [Burkholderia sp. AU44665]